MRTQILHSHRSLRGPVLVYHRRTPNPLSTCRHNSLRLSLRSPSGTRVTTSHHTYTSHMAVCRSTHRRLSIRRPLLVTQTRLGTGPIRTGMTRHLVAVSTSEPLSVPVCWAGVPPTTQTICKWDRQQLGGGSWVSEAATAPSLNSTRSTQKPHFFLVLPGLNHRGQGWNLGAGHKARWELLILGLLDGPLQ